MKKLDPKQFLKAVELTLALTDLREERARQAAEKICDGSDEEFEQFIATNCTRFAPEFEQNGAIVRARRAKKFERRSTGIPFRSEEGPVETRIAAFRARETSALPKPTAGERKRPPREYRSYDTPQGHVRFFDDGKFAYLRFSDETSASLLRLGAVEFTVKPSGKWPGYFDTDLSVPAMMKYLRENEGSDDFHISWE